MALSEADERRVEAEVGRMAAELRARPTQEKEDKIGLEIALLPAEERAFVPIALLRLIAAERDGGGRAGHDRDARRGVGRRSGAGGGPVGADALR